MPTQAAAAATAPNGNHSSIHSSGASPDIVAEVTRRILESGELGKLESHLLQLLQESGWSENLRNLCQERLRDPTANIGNYEELRNSVDTQAKEMVPEAVKAEMVKKIAVLLRGMCEE
ncbi:transcription factor e(y)2-domain-containing protein [Pyronema domesticum]|nr:transcription factor e(y)2-domain-containing protein [Pyronema domesticum]